MLSSPISKAILPRMTEMIAEQKISEFLSLYQSATKFVACIIFPLGMMIILNSKITLFAWTGDTTIAVWGAKILPVFIFGSLILSISSFQYYLQYAYGNLKYHIRWNTLSILINVPLIYFAALNYGVFGVAWVWLGYRLFSLLVWVPFIHYKFTPSINGKWMRESVLIPFLVASLVTYIFSNSVQFAFFEYRGLSILFLAGGVLVSMTITFIIVFNVSIWRKISAY
jgi:O-antigen/teichoic acid export membrane protein